MSSELEMSGRNPKDLKQMVAASHGDMDDMQTNLAKLKALSEDDKSENALLRGRIDEQSQLIMILKQRTDEATLKMRTLDRVNRELEDFRNNAEEEYRMINKKYNMLDARFSDLAYNHEEMIKIKDDYKNRNKELTRENSRLVDENGRLFSKAIEEKDSIILELEKKVTGLRDKCLRCEQRNKELEETIRTVEEKYKTENKDLRSKLTESEERLKAAVYRLKQTADTKDQIDAESYKRIQALTKEKNELLDLAMSRGKLIQDKQTENKKLQQKIEQMEKSVRDMQSKFEHDAAAVNVNLQVRRIRNELEESEEHYDELTREYDAYKKHSNALLQKEKQLNERLRHLVG